MIEAVNGQEGIEITEREKPDLILMDLSLPVVDGWEATRQIKANNDLQSIPIIALTAHAMVGDKKKALAAGCDDYLVKPLDEEVLMARIEKYLE